MEGVHTLITHLLQEVRAELLREGVDAAAEGLKGHTALRSRLTAAIFARTHKEQVQEEQTKQADLQRELDRWQRDEDERAQRVASGEEVPDAPVDVDPEEEESPAPRTSAASEPAFAWGAEHLAEAVRLQVCKANSVLCTKGGLYI